MSEISRAPAHVSEVDARACLLPTTAPVPARETSSPDVDLRDEAAPLLTRDAAPGRRSEKSGPMAILRSISASSMVFVGGAVASLAAVILMGYSPFETSGARDQLGVEPIARALQHQVVVAFQSAGFVNYHATVRLFRAAFPDKDIILVDAGDANADVDNRHVFARSSADGLPVDFVVEGPNVHRWRDGANACRWTVGHTVDAGWLQMVNEPQYVYEDHLWCPHARAPTVRLDTTTTNMRAYDEAHTTFLWSPYSQYHLISYLDKFADRKIRHLETQPFDRPYFAAYTSSDCKSFRDEMFRALKNAARVAGRHRGGEAHALGTCSHNHDWAPGTPYPPPSLYSPYEEYRFVMAFESVAERGYLSEKLGAALLSGSVPVFWGDSDAAERVFNPRSYVDAKKFWAENGSREAAMDIRRATGEDFAKLARYLTEIDSDRELYESYLLEDVRAIPKDTETADEALPYPFPSARLRPPFEANARPRVHQAVLRLRNQYEDGRQRRKQHVRIGADRPGRMYASINWRKDSKDAGSVRRVYEEPEPVEKLTVPTLDAPDEGPVREVEFLTRGKAEVLSLAKEREKETAPMKKREPVLSEPEKNAVKDAHAAAKTQPAELGKTPEKPSKHEEALRNRARGSSARSSAKPSIRPRETDGGEFEDYALERKAAENEVATEAPRETVEVDYGPFEHVDAPATASDEFPVEEKKKRRAERRRAREQKRLDTREARSVRPDDAIADDDVKTLVEVEPVVEVEPGVFEHVVEIKPTRAKEAVKAAGPVKVEKIPERAAKQTPPVEASVAKRIAATQKRSRRVDERVAPSETDSVLGDDQPGQNPARLVDDSESSADETSRSAAPAAPEPFDDVPVIMGGWNEYAGVPKPEREVFEHVVEIKPTRAKEAVKAAGPVKVEKIPERAAKQTPPVEASVAKRIAATQKRSRRVDERVAPSETDSVLGDDQPGQNPARLVDDSESSADETSRSAAPAAPEPFDDVPVIMGGWNEYAGVPKPERETSRPTFKARDPHEISEIRGGWNANRGESRDSGATGLAETDEMNAAAEPTMEPTVVPEFHVEERDMLEEVFDILERGAA